MKRKVVVRLGESREEWLEAALDKANRDKEFYRRILIDTMHEARDFSKIISAKSNELIRNPSYKRISEGVVENIFYASGMLASRFGFTDMEIDPASMSRQVKQSVVIYQKFDKSRYFLNNLRDYSESRIRFHGESHMSIQALRAFDMVPYVILQNAVKYSPPGYGVDVYFEEVGVDMLEVKVSSYGPLISGDESEKLFQRGYRGRSAEGHDGEGLGLYLAKRLCDFHNSSIEISAGDILNHQLNGKHYGKFNVKMIFEKFGG